MRTIIALTMLLLAAMPALGLQYHDYYGPYSGEDFIEWREAFERYDTEHIIETRPKKFFGGCYIAGWNQPMVADLDCDDVPDPIDNCPGVANPRQEDQTGNGLGDACDVYIERVDTMPERVMDGRAVEVTLRVANYRAFPLRNVEVIAEVAELNLRQKLEASQLKPGEAEEFDFLLRVPRCAPDESYDVDLTLQFPVLPGEKEYFETGTSIQVVPSGTCEPREDRSIITILDIQDVDREAGGVYPFTIVNHEPFDQTYVLSVDGLGDWGTYQFERNSLFIVPAGQSREGELRVYADEGATGEHGFSVTARSRTDAQTVMLTAHIEEQREEERNYGLFVLYGILVAALAVLVATLILVGQRLRTPE